MQNMKSFGVFFCLLWLPLSGYAQQKPMYEIGLLADKITPEIAPLVEQLKQEIIAVVGEDATITFPDSSTLANNFDRETARQQYQTLIENDTDLIIAFGPVNNEVISAQTTHVKPTILFGAVNLDLIDYDPDQETSGIDNYTYLITSQSYRRDLNTFKSLYDFQHLGIMVPAQQVTVLPFIETFDTLLAELEAAYTLIPFRSMADIALPDDIDAVYLAEAFDIRLADLKALADLMITRKLPSFSASTRYDVESGWMATNQPDARFDQFFRRIALSVEAAVNGENLANLPLFIDYSENLTMNYNTAELVGVPIKYSLIATTNFVGDFVNVLSEKTYSLVDVIEEALAENLSLAAGRKNVALAEQDVRSARSNYLPSLTASAAGTYIDPELAELSGGQNPEYSTSGNVTLNQTLFSEAANANIGIQKSLLKAEQSNYNADELDLILNAANAYFNTLILKANAQIRAQNLDVTKRNLKIAEQNFEAGQAGQSDVLRFRSEMAQNMQSMVEAVNQLEQGFHAINQLLNNPIDFEIDVLDADLEEGVFMDYNYEQLRIFIDDPSLRKVFVRFLVSEALHNAPELRALDYNLEAIERNITLNGPRRFLPTVAAQAQYNRTFDQWGTGALDSNLILKDNYNVGLNLSIPIFDGNRENINRQTAILQREQLAINKDNTARAIERNVQDAVLDLINQMTNLELSKVSEQTAVQSLDLTQTAYSNGAVNIVQLLDAQNNLLQAQLARATAVYNYLLTSIIMERSLGYYFLLQTEAEFQAFVQRFLAFQRNMQE